MGKSRKKQKGTFNNSPISSNMVGVKSASSTSPIFKPSNLSALPISSTTHSSELSVTRLAMPPLPPDFLDMLQDAVGPKLSARIIDAIENSIPVTSVRINPAKWSANLPLVWTPISPKSSPSSPIPNVSSSPNIALSSSTIFAEAVPWCQLGLYLSTRPNFTLDPILHSGAYYVQEPSSMILEILRPLVSKANRVLDLCAAPGGKSTHLATMLSQSGQLIANEVIRTRASVLRENITKWGDPRVRVTSLDPSAFAPRGEEFGFILVDAPCSGEGMFRKDPSAVSEWSPKAVADCVARQRKIVQDIWNALEPGGYLAYSTCTMNRYENEENVEWFASTLGAETVPLGPYLEIALSQGSSISSSSNPQPTESPTESQTENPIENEGIYEGIIITPTGSLRLHPGLVKGEGLFLALLRKPSEHLKPSDLLPQSQISLIPQKDKSQTSLIPRKDKSYTSLTPNNDKRHTSVISRNDKLRSFLTPSQSKSEAPDHSEALAINYMGEWPSLEVSREQALIFLSRGILVLPDAPLGYLRITYGGLGLGFVKNIGTRANNLLPSNLRIRMQF